MIAGRESEGTVLGVYVSEAMMSSPLEELDLDGDTDTILVEAAATDPSAFVRLYDRYRRPVYRYCLARLGSERAAIEATADIFLQVYQHLCRYPGGPFASWLYTIARHVVSEHRQGRRLTELPLR